MFRVDTQRVLTTPRDAYDDAKTIYERMMDLVAAGVEYITDALWREDSSNAMQTAISLVENWAEGCAAYQRYAPTLASGSPIAFAASALLAQRQRLLASTLSGMQLDKYPEEYRQQADRLRKDVLMSIIDIPPNGLNPRVVAKLSESLRVPIEVYARDSCTAWALLRIAFKADRSIHITSLIVSNDSRNEAMLMRADPHGQCADYRDALIMFRQLRERAEGIIARSQQQINKSSPLWRVWQLLNSFDQQIMVRQADMMKGGLISIDSLAFENSLLMNYYRKLAAVIEHAEALEFEQQCKLHELDDSLD